MKIVSRFEGSYRLHLVWVSVHLLYVKKMECEVYRLGHCTTAR